MSCKKVAVVIGGNRGIGFSLVEALCQEFNGDVILCSRDKSRGEEAVKELHDRGLNNVLLQVVSITDPLTVYSLKDFLQEKYSGLDLLVNNAGLFLPEQTFEASDKVILTNYFGISKACDILFPLLRDGSRVVNVVSNCGLLNWIRKEDLRQRIYDVKTPREIDMLGKEYLDDVAKGKEAVSAKGWPQGPFGHYMVSKILLVALTRSQQRFFDENDKEKDIVVNAVHPGFVKTEMTQMHGCFEPKDSLPALLRGCLASRGGGSEGHRAEPRGEFIWEDASITDWRQSEQELLETVKRYAATRGIDPATLDGNSFFTT